MRMVESSPQQLAVSKPKAKASTAGPKDLESGEDIELQRTTEQPARPSDNVIVDAPITAFRAIDVMADASLAETESLSQRIWHMLEDRSKVWVFEYRKESKDQSCWTPVYEHFFRDGTDGPEIPTMPDTAADPQNGHNQPHFRLILVEGLCPSVVTSLSSAPLDIPDDFFRHHLEGEPDSRVRSKVEECFFVKWRRLGIQHPRHWRIEKRIEDGKPYDINTGIDPGDLQLDHKRFDRLPRVYRRCDLLDPCVQSPVPVSKQLMDKDFLYVSVEESISAFYKKIASTQIAVFVFDQPRQHAITPKNYKRFSKSQDGAQEIYPSFENLTACVERLKNELDIGGNHDSALQGLQKKIEDIVLRQVLQDQMQVLRQINRSLDIIDMKMADASALQLYISDWRVLFARLRMGLSANSESIASIRRYLSTSRSSVNQESEVHALNREMVDSHGFKELWQDINDIWRRQESTFQALMSTMGILESQKAIQEAKAVTKLTNLAFFFIPLTYVAGICGMNVPAFAAGSLKLWMFGACSIGLLLATYLVLYAQDLLDFSRNFQSNVTNTKLSVRAKQFLLRVIYWVKAILKFTGLYVIPFLTLSAAVAIPIWLVVTKTSLPYPAKIGVGYLVGNCSLATGLCVTRLFWRKTMVSDLAAFCNGVNAMAMFAVIGLTIWAICTRTNLSDGQKAGVSIGACPAIVLAAFPGVAVAGALTED